MANAAPKTSIFAIFTLQPLYPGLKPAASATFKRPQAAAYATLYGAVPRNYPLLKRPPRIELTVPAMSDPHQPFDLESISILIPKTRDGDEEAREQLLQQFQSYLQWMATEHLDAATRQKVAPSDVVQQTFALVVENFDGFRGNTQAEFRAWIKQILLRELADARRKFRTAKRDLKRERRIDGTESQMGMPPVDHNPTPATDAMSAERRRVFHDALSRLPDDYATVIRLRSIDRKSFGEIAESMNRTYDSVTKLWYRALMKFEEELQKSELFRSRIRDADADEGEKA